MRQINIANIDLNLLRVFDAIFRERNLTRAGAALHLTQPSMSHALSRLRAAFDDELFTRTPHGLEPTPHAMQLAGPIADAVAAIQRALSAANTFDPASAVMRMRLGLTDHASWVVLPHCVPRISREAPGIDLHTAHVNVESARDLLDRGMLDLAVVASGEHPGRFASRHVLTEHYVCIAAARHPLIRRKLTLGAFLAASHVLVAGSSEQRSVVDRLLAAQGHARRIALQVPFLAGVPRLVADSALLCSVPESLARELCAQGDLRMHELPFSGAEVEYYAVWHTRDEHGGAQRWLRELVFAACAGRLPRD